jgi:hypothetical protein
MLTAKIIYHENATCFGHKRITIIGSALQDKKEVIKNCNWVRKQKNIY